ncbi:hypothetical protein [Actinomadura violacea]|uniref:Uncharacterized protein n=1 Tax=Actinomadura violacea TaxID=2819934 RepID=A0ABS3RZG9_9ACTN|nr:hypothetical protein [Actinomadura violacea]MBO2462135.1 hypothetical protein [Actinomadura violacea]
MRKIAKTAMAAALTASAALGAGITGALPAHAGNAPIPADCSGRSGEAHLHRFVRYNNVHMRKYNNVDAQWVATLSKGKRLHSFYPEVDTQGRRMWASRAYVHGKYVCGYVYASSILWNKSW